VNRINELEMLKRISIGLLNEDKTNIAIMGLRRIGKTELLLKFKEQSKEKNLIIPYVNVQKVGDLRSFVFIYLREILLEIGMAKGIVNTRIEFTDWDNLLILATKLNLENEVIMLKEKQDLSLLFESQEIILEKLDIYCLYLLDEFQQVTQLNKRFLELMRAIVEKQKRIAYVTSGSSISMMEEIFTDKEKPFFAQFTPIYINPLTRNDSLSLSRKIIGKYDLIADENIHNRVYQLVAGNPFYIKSICRRLVLDFKGKISPQNVEYAFLKETLDEKGDIYLVLDYIFNESLSRAYKGKTHKEILLFLAKKEGLTLSEIARHLNKATGEVANYMKALLQTDLIVKQGYNYYFCDPILRFWLAETYLGLGRAKLKTISISEQLIKELQEKYLTATTDLGKAKEYEMKVKLEERYGIKLKNYPEEGEFDLVGQKEGTTFIFEIKWRNKPVDYNQISNFFTKVGKSKFAKEDKRLFIVSKEGFTKNADAFGKKHRIEMLRDE
jgi:hypothetical protein